MTISIDEAIALLKPIDDALDDIYELWNQCKANYQQPQRFRTYVVYLIQSLRNYTFRIQSLRDDIPSFEHWYLPWREFLKEQDILVWIRDSRNAVVKKKGLDAKSSVSVKVVNSYLRPVTDEFVLPITVTTDEIIRTVEKKHQDVLEAECIIEITRRWVHDDLPDWEILTCTAEAFRVFYAMYSDLFRFVTQGTLQKPAEGILGTSTIASMKLEDADLTTRVNPRSGEVYTSSQFPIEATKDPLVIDKIVDRYGIDKYSLGHSDDPIAHARQLLPFALNVLVKDGYHIPLLLLFKEDGNLIPMQIESVDRLSKHLLWHHIADVVAREKAVGLVFVGEMWIRSIEKHEEDGAVLIGAPEGETLIVCAECADGRSISFSTNFHRAEGRIILDATEEEDNPEIGFTEPIRQVWRELQP